MRVFFISTVDSRLHSDLWMSVLAASLFLLLVAGQTVSAEPPITDFTAIPTSGNSPLTVQFTDISDHFPTSWSWSFGDEDYTSAWMPVNAYPGWQGRVYHGFVRLPGGDLLVLGGYHGAGDFKNDVWRSEDNGATWAQLAEHAPWKGRYGPGVDVSPDGNITLTGGFGYATSGYEYKNDIWRPEDNGTTWAQLAEHAPWKGRNGPGVDVTPDGNITLTEGLGYATSGYEYKNDIWQSTTDGDSWVLVTEHATWPDRAYHSHVVMPDGSIIVMGGAGAAYYNDVWRSVDNGATWTRLTEHAGWTPRTLAGSVAMPDGSIIIMGGASYGTYKNDVWRSTDNGASWTLVNGSAGWSPRYAHTCVLEPDGSILLMGGNSYGANKKDVWRSTDNGVSWTLVDEHAEWSPRFGHASLVTPDGSVMLTGGADGVTVWDDIWRFQPGGSSEQNPSHTYTTAGTYTVSLTAANAAGSNAMVKEGYVTVTDGSGYPDRYVFVETGTSGNCVQGDADIFREALFGQTSGQDHDQHGWQDYDPTPNSNPIYYQDARVKHWAVGTSTNYVDKADFAYFHGHGWNAQVNFDYADPDAIYTLTPDIAQWGYETGSKIKWITFHSCATTNLSSWDQWIPSFKGLHAILGYNSSSICALNPYTAEVFAELMRGDYPDTTADPIPIIEAWKVANEISIDEQEHSVGVISVLESYNDYLPGFGPSTTPVRNAQGNYNFRYEHWPTKADTLVTTESTLQMTQKIEKTAGVYNLNVMTEPIPDKIMIYHTVGPVSSLERSRKISQELKIAEKSPVKKLNSGTIEPSADGKLFMTQDNAGTIIYDDMQFHNAFMYDKHPQSLPSDEQAIKTAKDFLIKAKLMSGEVVTDGTSHYQTLGIIGPSTTPEVIGETIYVFFHRELEGIKIENSKAIIEVGNDNKIVSSFLSWREYAPFKEVSVKPVDTAFAEFMKKSLKYQMKEKPEKIVVTDLSLVYYSQKPAAASDEKYLQPVYIFKGYVQNGNITESFDPVYISASVEQFDKIPGCAGASCN